MAKVVPVEPMYCLSLGSQQGNAQLHWHVAPLPPGVPYDRQHHYALMSENGVLDVTNSSQEALAPGYQEPRVTGAHLLPDAQDERGGVAVDERGASATGAFC